jgi:aminoglycoside phosphotransferase
MSSRWSAGEVRAGLEDALRERRGSETAITAFERRPSRYRTSFPIEELDVELASGESLELLFKDLSRESLGDTALSAKPADLYDPMREIEVYERLLPFAGVAGPPACPATVVDPSAGRYWLFIERVKGVELYQVGNRGTWEYVAGWLAGMHERLRPSVVQGQGLLRHDDEMLARWSHLAVERTPDPESRRRLAEIATAYVDAVVPLLRDRPTVIHGEFYASNVLVDDPDEPGRVAPVDWEMAGVGPPLLDLAALISGGWSEGDRAAIAAAYREAASGDDTDFEGRLDACRLHIALQWLGWSEDWTPPPEHATAWLDDVLSISEKLGI